MLAGHHGRARGDVFTGGSDQHIACAAAVRVADFAAVLGTDPTAGRRADVDQPQIVDVGSTVADRGGQHAASVRPAQQIHTRISHVFSLDTSCEVLMRLE